MSTADFSPTYRQMMVERMDRLTQILVDHGLSQTSVNRIARNDPAWTRDYRNKNFTVDTYDMAAARISAIWPDDVAWPSDIPRPAPSEIEPGALEEVAGRLERFRNRSEARHG